MLVWQGAGGAWQEWWVADSGVFIQCYGVGADVESKGECAVLEKGFSNLQYASELKLYQDLRVIAKRTKGREGVNWVYRKECGRSVKRVKGKLMKSTGHYFFHYKFIQCHQNHYYRLQPEIYLVQIAELGLKT